MKPLPFTLALAQWGYGGEVVGITMTLAACLTLQGAGEAGPAGPALTWRLTDRSKPGALTPVAVADFPRREVERIVESEYGVDPLTATLLASDLIALGTWVPAMVLAAVPEVASARLCAHPRWTALEARVRAVQAGQRAQRLASSTSVDLGQPSMVRALP